LYHEGGFGTITRGGSRGGNVTVNVASWGFGPSARMVVDLSSIENSYGVYPGGQSGSPSSPHYDDLLDIYYTFDETTQHYGYHDMCYYPTASEFIDSDTDSSMIEYVIRFEKQVETNIDDITEEEPDNESNGWIPGYPLLSIALAILLVIIIFYMKQNQ
jgi:hypothetical protein